MATVPHAHAPQTNGADHARRARLHTAAALDAARHANQHTGALLRANRSGDQQAIQRAFWGRTFAQYALRQHLDAARFHRRERTVAWDA